MFHGAYRPFLPLFHTGAPCPGLSTKGVYGRICFACYMMMSAGISLQSTRPKDTYHMHAWNNHDRLQDTPSFDVVTRFRLFAPVPG